MKRTLSIAALLALSTSISFAEGSSGCGTSASITNASADNVIVDTMTTASTVSVERGTVDALIAAMAAGDAAAVNAAFTPDAGYAYSLDGELNRGDAFDGWIASDITGPGSKFVIESATEANGTVDALVLWGRGEPSTPARYVFTIVDGKIDSWRMANR
jgi:hypothetical protein